LNIFELALQNLTSPPVLAFALGLLATAIKADLRLPDAVYQGLSFYLLLGIGIKGGVALRDAEFGDIALPILGTIALGIVIPLLAFSILGPLTKLPAAEKGALAAHYGSTSLVTFTAAIVFLDTAQTFVEGYMATLLAVLEIPGIIVGLLLASRGMSRSVNFKESLTEVLTGKSIILLAGGLLLGAITGSSGYSQVEPFFGGLFTGVLTLFLLELGLIAGKRIGDLRSRHTACDLRCWLPGYCRNPWNYSRFANRTECWGSNCFGSSQCCIKLYCSTGSSQACSS